MIEIVIDNKYKLNVKDDMNSTSDWSYIDEYPGVMSNTLRSTTEDALDKRKTSELPNVIVHRRFGNRIEHKSLISLMPSRKSDLHRAVSYSKVFLGDIRFELFMKTHLTHEVECRVDDETLLGNGYLKDCFKLASTVDKDGITIIDRSFDEFKVEVGLSTAYFYDFYMTKNGRFNEMHYDVMTFCIILDDKHLEKCKKKVEELRKLERENNIKSWYNSR